ncbi:hypothetical protein GQ53DRAFT_699035 [Thozetella sp. PMI_491]|nr:hypothetical protein GQ53DRAFT_699035 [Thozetella sp. PMI_491]
MNAEKQWTSKKEEGWGKTKTRFFGFMETMKDHSYLFSFIPDGDKYFSLFTGVVSSIVKVSANYKKITEGFSLALLEIGDDLQYVRRSSRIAGSPEMKVLIVRLYVQVFRLLCYAMQFYQSRRNRVKVSFNQNFYQDRVQKMVCDIQRTVQLVRRESELVTQDRVENTEARVSKLTDHLLDLKLAGKGANDNDLKEMNKKFDLVLHQLKKLDQSMSRHLLLAEEQDSYGGNREPLPILEHETDVLVEVEDESQDEMPLTGGLESSDNRCTRYELSQASSFMNSIVEDGRRDIASSAGLSRSVLPTEILERIQQWIKRLGSQILWINCGESLFPVSELSLLALHLTTTSTNAGIPCVSFFCKRRYTGVPEDGKFSPSKGELPMLVLLFSIIKQLISLLPHEFTAQDDLGEAQLLALKDNPDRCSAALDIIRSLIKLAPLSVLFVIDGLQLILDGAAQRHLVALIGILRAPDPQRVVKVLLTTTGNSLALTRSVRIGERADSGRVAQGPGLLMKGGASVNALRM